MSEAGWGIVFLLDLATIVALLVAIVIWQVFKPQQTKVKTSTNSPHDAAYRELAVRAIEAQETAVSELVELRGRVNELERMLKEAG